MLLMASVPGTKLHDTFLKNYRELGPVWSISLPGIGRMIEGDSPELIEHVVMTNFSAYEKGDYFNTALGDIFRKESFVRMVANGSTNAKKSPSSSLSSSSASTPARP
ncbi:hypothetical protein BKA57DRAFT_520532 [Linnemannia elongata]|nr:hypothetical protein BKA57DRAFT_520532 [Linnemannia elongata]